MGVREVGLGGKGRRGEERGGGSEESGRTRAGWRLWNRGSMCRPRVQRVASACALTSSRSLSLSHLLPVSFLLFAFTRGLLIRRERGDNSSPSLSLDDARFPPRVVPHRLTPSTVLMPSPERGHAVVPFPTAYPMSPTEPDQTLVLVGDFSLRNLRHGYRHRPSWVGLSLRASSSLAVAS